MKAYTVTELANALQVAEKGASKQLEEILSWAHVLSTAGSLDVHRLVPPVLSVHGKVDGTRTAARRPVPGEGHRHPTLGKSVDKGFPGISSSMLHLNVGNFDAPASRCIC